MTRNGPVGRRSRDSSLLVAVCCSWASSRRCSAAPDTSRVRVWQDTMRNPDIRGRTGESKPAVRSVLVRAIQLSLSDPRRADEHARAVTLAQPAPRERVPAAHGASGSRRPRLQLPGQADGPRDVLRERRDQEGADRLSRRMGGVRHRVQLSRLAQLDVAVAGGLRDRAAPGRQRIDLGRQHRSGLWRAVAGGVAPRARRRAALEQRTDLYNASDVRHRYYWWNNAAVQVWEDSRLVYPTELMATHGFTRIEPWPIDRAGRDLSVIRNQTDGPVSLFTYGTREGFVGVYHPHTQQRHRPRRGSARSFRPTRSGRGATIATPPTGARRCPTTTAATSSCSPACFAIRRPTPSSNRRRACTSPNTGFRYAISAASRARTPTRSCTWIGRRRAALRLALDVTRDIPDARRHRAAAAHDGHADACALTPARGLAARGRRAAGHLR